MNHTGYAQTIVETTKNAAGVATKRIVYTYGTDEITQTTYLPLPNGGEGATLTYSHDAHTSVRMLSDTAGAIAQVFTYAAYGELIAIHNQIAQAVGTVGTTGLQSQALTSLLYNGEDFDSRIGQMYLRARFYDLHRFTTLDPFFCRNAVPGTWLVPRGWCPTPSRDDPKRPLRRSCIGTLIHRMDRMEFLSCTSFSSMLIPASWWRSGCSRYCIR